MQKRLGTKKPVLREMSFSGNMPSPYEKDLKKALAKSQR